MVQFRGCWASALGLVVALSAQAQTSTPQQEEAARVARLRLLCATLSGGDLTDPLDQLRFQRCLKNPPVQAMKENLPPPKAAVNPFPNLVTRQQTLVNPQAGAVTPAAPHHSDICAQGYVWREAAPEDHVCVTPLVHTQTALDNTAAEQRKQPNSPRCQDGFVWREAFPGDSVCVTPTARAQARDDNGQSRVRLAEP